MIIKLSKYDDCGKCTSFTCMDQWDTDKDKIVILDDNFKAKEERKVNNLEELKPYLWAIPFVHYGGTEAPTILGYFEDSIKPWWILRNESVDWHNKRAEENYEELKKENGL